MSLRVTIIAVCFLWAAIGHTTPCDPLSAKQRTLAQKLFKTTYPYDCCDETLDRCLKQPKVCKLAKRLRDDICRRIGKGQGEKKIKNALARRTRSMTPTGKKASFDLSKAAVVGEPNATVSVVVYACARCPFCRKVVPDLYRLVENGGLKGRVKLYFRPFPIRSHKGSIEGGLAFIAAQEQGKFWPYMMKLYAEYAHFSADKLVVWADKVGLDRGAFEKNMKAKESRKLLVESKKEGLRNKVNATPTIFINGRKYFGDMDHDSLLDVLDEEADKTRGKQFCGK